MNRACNQGSSCRATCCPLDTRDGYYNLEAVCIDGLRYYPAETVMKTLTSRFTRDKLWRAAGQASRAKSKVWTWPDIRGMEQPITNFYVWLYQNLCDHAGAKQNVPLPWFSGGSSSIKSELTARVAIARAVAYLPSPGASTINPDLQAARDKFRVTGLSDDAALSPLELVFLMPLLGFGSVAGLSSELQTPMLQPTPLGSTGFAGKLRRGEGMGEGVVGEAGDGWSSGGRAIEEKAEQERVVQVAAIVHAVQ